MTEQREIAIGCINASRLHPWMCSPKYMPADEVWRCSVCKVEAFTAYALVPGRSRYCGNGLGTARTHPISQPEKKRILADLGIARPGQRGRRLSTHEIKRRADSMKESDSAGHTAGANRWTGWKCPHPGCDFTMPEGTAYMASVRRKHLSTFNSMYSKWTRLLTHCLWQKRKHPRWACTSRGRPRLQLSTLLLRAGHTRWGSQCRLINTARPIPQLAMGKGSLGSV